MIESILNLELESSFLTGSIMGKSIQIDKELGEQPYNFITGYYDPGETSTRFASDDEGLLYFSVKNNDEEYILCYGRDGEELVLGMGIDAKTAQEALLHGSGEQKTIQKIVRSEDSLKLQEVTLRFNKHEKVSEWVRLPLLPRDFTWHFGLGPTAKTIEVLETELGLKWEGIFAFGYKSKKIYQQINNDFVVKLSVSQVGDIYFAKAYANMRNNNNDQFIVFAKLQDNFGMKYWEAYENEKNPCWGVEGIIDAMQKKIASQQTRSFNKLLGRGSVSWEEIEKYFIEKEVFSATPNDSRSVGNCASGTRNWMVANKFINHEGSVSWDDFPVPIDQPYSIPVKTALRLAHENSRFKAVIQKIFTGENPQKGSLSSEQVQKVLFQKSEEILTTEEIILIENSEGKYQELNMVS